jgi:hypothetical protein
MFSVGWRGKHVDRQKYVASQVRLMKVAFLTHRSINILSMVLPNGNRVVRKLVLVGCSYRMMMAFGH